MTEPQPKNSDLGVRAASAVVIVAISLTALWLGGWAWMGFAMLVAGGVLYEWRALVRGWSPSPLGEMGWTLGGILYLAPATAMLMLMREGERGFADVLTLIALVAAIDIGAYFTGRALGGPKIAPKISPSKTWAGLLGGILGATAVLILSAKLSAAIPAWWQVLGLAVLAAVVAQSGDFFESWMKRRAGVKDSGKLIPGHGGLFDRVDGLIAVSFMAALLAALSVL
ncbi:MAG: phosphatidate cytidylyltransferase [Novosphingobium sp.]